MFLRYSDALDKGTHTVRLQLYDFMAYLYDRVAVDFFQERVLHEGPQKNESAIEQAKDQAISNTIRHQFESITGKHFPGKDKT